MNPPAKLSELVDSLEMWTDIHHIYFDRQTGEIVIIDKSVLSAVEEGDEASLENLPAWQKPEIETAKAVLAEFGDRFIRPPDKFEFHEYQHMERFIETIADPDIAGQLFGSIRGSGAFRRFKNTLFRLRLEDRWYRYRDQAMKAFAIEWAEDNNVSYEDDLKGRGEGR